MIVGELVDSFLESYSKPLLALIAGTALLGGGFLAGNKTAESPKHISEVSSIRYEPPSPFAVLLDCKTSTETVVFGKVPDYYPGAKCLADDDVLFSAAYHNSLLPINSLGIEGLLNGQWRNIQSQSTSSFGVGHILTSELPKVSAYEAIRISMVFFDGTLLYSPPFTIPPK